MRIRLRGRAPVKRRIGAGRFPTCFAGRSRSVCVTSEQQWASRHGRVEIFWALIVLTKTLEGTACMTANLTASHCSSLEYQLASLLTTRTELEIPN